jgi:hypothetical protein
VANYVPNSDSTPSLFGVGLYYIDSDYLSELFYVKNKKQKKISIHDGDSKGLPLILNATTQVASSTLTTRFEGENPNSYYIAKAQFHKITNELTYVEVKEYSKTGRLRII